MKTKLTPGQQRAIKAMQAKSQTPAARAKRVATRAATMARKSSLNIDKGTPRYEQHSELPDHVVSYALGHVEAWLQVYAASHRVPVSSLAHRLGTLLQAASRR